MKVRFTLNGNVCDVVDHTPRGTHEVALAQVELWQAAGVPLELIDSEPIADNKSVEQPKGRKPPR